MPMKTLKHVLIALNFLIISASSSLAFDKVGIAWCDQLLNHYQRCLQRMVHGGCAKLAAKRSFSETACLADVRSLVMEMVRNIAVYNAIFDRKSKQAACTQSVKRIVNYNLRVFGCR